MAELDDRIADLLSAILEAQRRYTSLAYDDTECGTLAPPATEAQIAGLERRFGRRLPSAYTAFLRQHAGFSGFHADGAILGTADRDAPWVVKRVAQLGRNWEPVDPNPFETGALPLMIGEDIQHFVVIAGDRQTRHGEPALVEYDQGAEYRSFDSFVELLEAEREVLEALIDREMRGDTP